MSKFTDNASEKLLVVAGKISNQKHMASIKNAFYTLMPVILTGAFCTLISNVVCSTTTTGISLAKLPGMSWLGMFTDLFNAANYATLNFFTVAAVFLIGMELAKQNGLGDSPDSGVVAVCSFISVLPTYVHWRMHWPNRQQSHCIGTMDGTSRRMKSGFWPIFSNSHWSRNGRALKKRMFW